MRALVLLSLFLLSCASVSSQIVDGVLPPFDYEQLRSDSLEPMMYQAMWGNDNQQLNPGGPAFPFNPPSVPSSSSPVMSELQSKVYSNVNDQPLPKAEEIVASVSPALLERKASKAEVRDYDDADEDSNIEDSSESAEDSNFEGTEEELSEDVRDNTMEDTDDEPSFEGEESGEITDEEGSLDAAEDGSFESTDDSSENVENQKAAKTVPLTDSVEDSNEDSYEESSEVSDEDASEARFQESPPIPVTPPAPTSESGNIENSEFSQNSEATQPIQNTPSQSGESSGEYHKCSKKIGDKCVIDFPDGANWETKTVPRGSLKQDCPTCNKNLKMENVKPSEVGSFKFDSNEEIARLQKAYFEKKAELEKEKKWVVNVRNIVKEYKAKIFRVNAHIRSTESKLHTSAANIRAMIKRDKEKKLQAELSAALKALAKLKDTSSGLSSKITQLHSTKSKLQNTIKRISSALGKTSGDFDTSGGNAEMRFKEKYDANEEAKSIFSSLVEQASKVSDTHNEREKELNRFMKAPIMKRSTSDIYISRANIDPDLKRETLAEEVDQVLKETDRLSELE